MTFSYKLFAIGFLLLFTGCAARSAVETAGPGDMKVIAAETPATYRSSSLQALGSFETDFNTKLVNRSHNIAHASNSINNQVVQPGEIFSFNETVGPTSKKNGYKKGTIFVKGEQLEGYGGGVCQVSTTLYNAAANAGMTILERHDHSRPVDYVELGNDAATSYGGIDLKFQNDQPFPVVINSYVADGTVSVSINAM